MASPEPEKGEEVGASHVDPGGGFERKRRFSDEKQEGNPTSKKRLDEIQPATQQAATSGQSITKTNLISTLHIYLQGVPKKMLPRFYIVHHFYNFQPI